MYGFIFLLKYLSLSLGVSCFWRWKLKHVTNSIRYYHFSFNLFLTNLVTIICTFWEENHGIYQQLQNCSNQHGLYCSPLWFHCWGFVDFFSLVGLVFFSLYLLLVLLRFFFPGVILCKFWTFISVFQSVFRNLRDLGLSDLKANQFRELVNRLLPGYCTESKVSSQWHTSYVSAQSFFENKHGMFEWNVYESWRELNYKGE